MPARQVPDCPHPANITSPSQIPTHLRKHPQESSPYSALAFACNSTTESRLQLALKPLPHRFQANREAPAKPAPNRPAPSWSAISIALCKTCSCGIFVGVAIAYSVSLGGRHKARWLTLFAMKVARIAKKWEICCLQPWPDSMFIQPKKFLQNLQINSRKRAQFNHGRQTTDRKPATPIHPPGLYPAADPLPPLPFC